MPKIMVVDDSETVRTQVGDVLKSAGYEVLEAINGAAGVLLWEKHGAEISLILTDYNMPQMDGIAMIRRIRSTASGVDVAVFLQTTESSAQLKAVGRELAVKAWVSKPCPPEKLVAAINKILGF